ncbi:MAG TPA: 5'/3'-nucleotidase SurE [Terrimesophilobacter sp.]|uniref:5'/3'-nucleotidase SurE n=1 Tax=Terrimesophilobacter sp. TaxID=2906435 RepID=UPI002F94800B
MTTALITNDDGIESPGLHRLALVAADEGFDVVVAAPAGQSSGSSASITGTEADGRIRFERRTLDGLDAIPAFAVEAAPALIALIAAHGAFGAPPDLVFSGINRGANVGRAILHSGTVGAALTGGLNGARGIAVSLDVGMDPLECHWDAAAEVARGLLPGLLDHPVGTVFNVNVPNASGIDFEVREAPLASFGIVQTTMVRGDDEQVRLSVADGPRDQAEGSDAALLEAGFATVTSITSIAESRTQALAAENSATMDPPGPLT